MPAVKVDTTEELPGSNICDFVGVKTHPAITKLRVLSRKQQLIRLDFNGFEQVGPKPIYQRMRQLLATAGALVLSPFMAKAR
ncbi:hypothetical protein CHU98_g3628 [Xylaria longipes]|nr:hypothetical protein CHU98_g3628 [Xylaria longipes]